MVSAVCLLHDWRLLLWLASVSGPRQVQQCARPWVGKLAVGSEVGWATHPTLGSAAWVGVAFAEGSGVASVKGAGVGSVQALHLSLQRRV